MSDVIPQLPQLPLFLRRSSHQTYVERFMVQAGQTVRDVPTIPPLQERCRIISLILEELREAARAFGVCIKVVSNTGLPVNLTCERTEVEFKSNEHEIDLAAAVDGFADIAVTNTCALSACGVADEPLMLLINKNNLAKFQGPACPSCAQEMKFVSSSSHWICNHDHDGMGYITLPKEAGPWRREDGKLVKGTTFKPADVESLLTELQLSAEQLRPAEAVALGREPLLTLDQARGIAARGWTARANRHKLMDAELAEAIAHEIMLFFEGRPPAFFQMSPLVATMDGQSHEVPAPDPRETVHTRTPDPASFLVEGVPDTGAFGSLETPPPEKVVRHPETDIVDPVKWAQVATAQMKAMNEPAKDEPMKTDPSPVAAAEMAAAKSALEGNRGVSKDSSAEQLQVQLAGCLTAAEGGTSEMLAAKEGMYGWSPAYQAVLELRRKYDLLHGTLTAMLGEADAGTAATVVSPSAVRSLLRQSALPTHIGQLDDRA